METARQVRTSFSNFGGLFRDAGISWNRHNAPRLGAALAYYAVLSLAPMLIVGVAICGIAFGQKAARGEIYQEIEVFVGPQSAAIVETLLKSSVKPATGFVAGFLGIVTIIFGASGVFVELRDTLNYIWDAPAKRSPGVWSVVEERFLSFAMVAGAGFVLTVSLAVTALVQAASGYSRLFFPASLLEAANFVATLTLASVLFALVYRIIPEVRVDWQDVVTGSVVTGLLFSIGKLLIGVYLGRAGVGSPYGAAGSLVALLVWVYYSAQIFLFGAEFTHVCALRRRTIVRP